MTLKAAALRYAEHGWPVFPLNGKHPRKDSKAHLDATTDPAQIERWWDANPSYNIGIATGPAGLAVIDVDSPDALGWLESKLPETAVIETRPGRRHFLYAGECKSSAGRLAPKVDTRGTGGYIVAPPSIHPDTGKPYRWVDKRQPAELPGWVNEALSQNKAAEVPSSDGTTTAYGQAVLNGELSKLVQSPNGSRNDTLFTCAVRVFELVKAGQIEHVKAADALKRAAAGTGLPQSEYGRTLVSAWERAEAKPPEDRPDSPEPDSPAVHEPRFMTLEDLEKIPPPVWLVPQVLPEGFTVLYGRRNSGKTFIALDLALTLASYGTTVVYCAGEGVSGLRSRVDAWAKAHPTLRPDGFRVLALGAYPRLLNEQSVALLHRDLHSLSDDGTPAGLLVLDTLRRSMAGASVSDDLAVGRVVETLDDIRNRHGGTSSLVIHHPRRPTKDDPNPPEAGSGSLLDSADFAWKLVGRADDLERTLYNEKVKDWETLHPLRVSLRPYANSLIVNPPFSDLMEDGDG